MERVEEGNENIAQRKKAVRREVLAIRDSINSDDKIKYDAKIREIVREMTEYQESEVILAYVNYKSEVDTILLIQQALKDGKKVFAPKVSGNEMEFWQISSLEDLREGYRGILEPRQSITFPDWIVKYTDGTEGDADINIDADAERDRKVCKVLMWMPGAAFDTERHRIGYGGGFYDKYLNRLSYAAEQTNYSEQQRLLIGNYTLTTAALTYHCQIMKRIPCEEHDRRPDLLITEQGIYR